MSTAVAEDPTLASLDRLNDESRWVIVKNVPVWKPHVRRAKNGSVLYEVGMPDIEAVAENSNALEANHGVPVRLQIGHTMPVAETEQAKHVGWVRLLRPGFFGPKSAPAMLSNLYYSKEHWEEAKKYPFRSVEYWPGSREIRAVALLLRDPELDLGALIFEREIEAVWDKHGETVYFYSHNWDANSEVEPYQTAATSGTNTAVPAPAGNQDEDPEFSKKLMRHLRDMLPRLLHEHIAMSTTQPQQHQAAAVSGTNPAMPAPVGPPPVQPGATPPKQEPLVAIEPAPYQRQQPSSVTSTPPPASSSDPVETLRLQQTQSRIEFAQYQRDMEDLKAKVAVLETRNEALETQRRRAQRERDLAQKLHEGHTFDLADAMAYMGDLPEELYQKSFGFMFKHAIPKGPVSTRMLSPYSGSVEGTTKDPNEIPQVYEGGVEDFENAAFDEMVNYQRQTGKPWEEVEKEFTQRRQKKTG